MGTSVSNGAGSFDEKRYIVVGVALDNTRDIGRVSGLVHPVTRNFGGTEAPTMVVESGIGRSIFEDVGDGVRSKVMLGCRCAK